MQQDERPGTGGPAAGGQLAREGHKEGKIIRNKEIQRDAGTAQGHGIGSGIGKGPGKQGEIPEKAFIRTETEITGEKEYEYQIKVKGERQANELLSSLIGAGVTVVTFDLREPSLHEIFVEKVGEANDALED